MAGNFPIPSGCVWRQKIKIRMPASFLPDLIAGTKKRETSFFLELCAGQQYPNPKPTQKPPQTKPKPTIKPTPKIIPNQPQKQTRPQITPIQPPFAHRTILFLVPREVRQHLWKISL